MSQTELQKGGIIKKLPPLPVFKNFCILNDPLFIKMLKEYIKNKRN